MKVKIKGLVFVGFAAAILSANAMAAQRTRPAGSSNTVTSQAFTEAKYEWLSDKVGTTPAANSELWNSEDAYPSMAVLKDVADAVTETNNATQEKSTADWQVGNDQGTWSTVTNGTYTTISQVAAASGDNPETVKIEVNATTNSALPAADADKLPTAGAVKTYADTKLNHKLGADGTQANPSTDTGKVLVIDETGEIVMSDAAGTDTYQAKTTATQKKVVGDPNGAWSAINTAVKESASGYIDINLDATANDGSILVDIDSAKIVGTKAAVTGGSDELTTATGVKEYAQKISESANQVSDGQGGWKALNSSVTVTNGTATEGSNGATTQAIVDYVQSQTHGNVIPEQDPTVCTAQHPCALVNEAGTLHWYTMAQSNYAGGELGDAQ